MWGVARRLVGVRGACGRSREVPRTRGIVGGSRDVRQARENSSEAPEVRGFRGAPGVFAACGGHQEAVGGCEAPGVGRGLWGCCQEAPGIRGGCMDGQQACEVCGGRQMSLGVEKK